MASLTTLFNDNWYFKRFDLGTPYDEMSGSKDLKPVAIPHDWQIWDTADLYENVIGFYKKSFSLDPKKDHTYIIRFDAVYMDTTVYLNHEMIYEWKYGYSAFDVDITDYLTPGENIIEVSCVYQAPNTRWYSGAGIYRNVHFTEKENAYIIPDGVYVSTKCEENGDFTLFVDCEARLANGYKSAPANECDALISHVLTDAEGAVKAEISEKITLGRDVAVSKQIVRIGAPRRWDVDDPYLYKLTTTLTADGTELDRVINNVGFRTIRFDPDKGFFLNERSVKINGACMHHDLGSLGAAFNTTALRRQFLKLKEMGVNSVRTSHNMPAPELLDVADEIGIMINTEAFDMWEHKKTEYDYARFFPSWYERDVRSWVRQDRNHPSVIIFSIGNEIYDCHLESGRRWNALLRDEVKKYDYRHNAYIGSGSNYMQWENAQKCADDLEIAGYNYGEKMYDEHHAKNPGRCIFGSETASTVQSRGIYHFPLSKRLLTHDDGQCSCLGNCTTNWGGDSVDQVVFDHHSRDFAAGQYIWTGWDYIGEPTPYFSKNSYFGQLDTAGFEKDTFYHYKAEWTDYRKAPMVHILPYWDFNPGQIIDVCVYSNAPKVALFFNDELIGEQTIDHDSPNLTASWSLKYQIGTLTARAYDEIGREIASDSVSSFGDPVKIVLDPDKTVLKADPEDLIFVGISVVDNMGREVKNARNRINIKVSGAGRLVGLDNGDSTDYEQYKCTSRKLFSGKLMAIIASNGEEGDILLTASSKDLEGADVTLKAVKSTVKPGSAFMDPCVESAPGEDVPIRKIELIYDGSRELTPDHNEATLDYKIYPENATFKDLSVKVLTVDAVAANNAEANIRDGKIYVKATGDGDFRLSVRASNGSGLSEIVSELEFTASGLGSATVDPYEPVPGIQYSRTSSSDAKLTFLGGVFVTVNGSTYVTYDNLDFGDFGSDEVTLPIFIFNNEMPISIYEGTPENGELLGSFTYSAEWIYNTYIENTFKLKRKLKGITSVSFEFKGEERVSFKGFTFKKINKAYEIIDVGLRNRIVGDSFKLKENAIEHIGNNVCIDFNDLNLCDGFSAVTICGRSNNEKTSIHLIFTNDETHENRLAEIPYSEDYGEFRIPLQSLVFNGKVSFVFLPGSDFDLKWFRFEK